MRARSNWQVLLVGAALVLCLGLPQGTAAAKKKKDAVRILATIGETVFLVEDYSPSRKNLKAARKSKYSGYGSKEKYTDSYVVGTFRSEAIRLVLTELAHICDLRADESEVSAFINWWRTWATNMVLRAEGFGRPFHPSAYQDIRIDNETVNEFSVRKVEAWKANSCLQSHYGGGKFFIFGGPKDYQQPDAGSNYMNYLGVRGGFIYPVNGNSPMPLRAFASLMDDAFEFGAIKMPDAELKQMFLGQFQSERLVNMPAEMALPRLKTPFWKE